MPRKRATQRVDVAEIESNAQCPEVATFAKTLDELLEIKGMHQTDFEKATGIASGTISAYRNGKSAPGLVNLVKMADCLGVDCHYLMTGVQAKNYRCAEDLGLSETAIKRLHELSEYIKANPAGLVPNPYDVLLSYDGPEYILQPEGQRVSASKVFGVSLANYLHERSTEVGPDMITGIDDKSNAELFALSEQLAKIGYTIVPKQTVTESILQKACDALKALFQEYGDNMKGANNGKH